MKADPLRRVVAYGAGGADAVLFECGHVCIMELAPRRSYPKRRRCFRCGADEKPSVPDLARFQLQHGDNIVIAPDTPERP